MRIILWKNFFVHARAKIIPWVNPMTRARARCARAKNNTRLPMMCAFSSCPPCLHIQATLCACVLQGTPLCAPQGTPAHACLSTKTTNYIPFSLLKNNIYYYIIIAKAKILKKKLSSIFLWLIRVCYFHEKTILQKYLSQTIIITLIIGSHSFENFKVITK